MIRLDALFLNDDKTDMEIVNAWSEGLGINFAPAEDGVINCIISPSENNETLFKALLPLDAKQENHLIKS